MSVVRRQSAEVFADYKQFYVQDAGIDPPAPEDWTDDDIANRSKVAENVVVVCPLRNVTVPVDVVLHDSEPPPGNLNPDHVVECSLALPTGRLQVHECTGGEVLNWELPPGTYCVRLSYFGLATIASNGLEGGDFYVVELWQGPSGVLSVRKSWRQ